MSNFTTIESSSLEAVTGGGTSAAEGQAGIQVKAKGVDANIGVSGKTASTDYKTCVDAVLKAGGAPTVIKDVCGLPPSN